MTQKEFRYKNWFLKYTPDDGGRLDQLSYNKIDLLTKVPEDFKSPNKDYGEYENRPVYGYDDCFPSVSKCSYPDSDWVVPDHGEVCWLPWKVNEKADRLQFSVNSKTLPLLFKRELIFSEDKLTWMFEVHNRGNETLPFQHVIHPLMPLNEVMGLQMPEFETVFDDINQNKLNINTSNELEKYLLEQPKGTANMLFLQAVKEGQLRLKFKAGLTLEMQFPQELFPTIGIWWNNYGYPDEEGIRRIECAFEPISGSNSSLEDAHKEGSCLSVASGQQLKWKIEWRIK